MLVGVATLPPSFPTLWNIGILLHKQATRGKHFESECITAVASGNAFSHIASFMPLLITTAIFK